MRVQQRAERVAARQRGLGDRVHRVERKVQWDMMAVHHVVAGALLHEQLGQFPRVSVCGLEHELTDGNRLQRRPAVCRAFEERDGRGGMHSTTDPELCVGGKIGLDEATFVERLQVPREPPPIHVVECRTEQLRHRRIVEERAQLLVGDALRIRMTQRLGDGDGPVRRDLSRVAERHVQQEVHALREGDAQHAGRHLRGRDGRRLRPGTPE